MKRLADSTSLPIFAHSLENCSEERWGPLADHLALVGRLTAQFAGQFGADVLGDVAGRLHDVGRITVPVYLIHQAGLRNGELSAFSKLAP
ncbi:MAG: hypothetical protein WC692_12800 [Erythrobacter sp.]